VVPLVDGRRAAPAGRVSFILNGGILPSRLLRNHAVAPRRPFPLARIHTSFVTWKAVEVPLPFFPFSRDTCNPFPRLAHCSFGMKENIPPEASSFSSHAEITPGFSRRNERLWSSSNTFPFTLALPLFRLYGLPFPKGSTAAELSPPFLHPARFPPAAHTPSRKRGEFSVQLKKRIPFHSTFSVNRCSLGNFSFFLSLQMEPFCRNILSLFPFTKEGPGCPSRRVTSLLAPSCSFYRRFSLERWDREAKGLPSLLIMAAISHCAVLSLSEMKRWSPYGSREPPPFPVQTPAIICFSFWEGRGLVTGNVFSPFHRLSRCVSFPFPRRSGGFPRSSEKPSSPVPLPGRPGCAKAYAPVSFLLPPARGPLVT